LPQAAFDPDRPRLAPRAGLRGFLRSADGGMLGQTVRCSKPYVLYKTIFFIVLIQTFILFIAVCETIFSSMECHLLPRDMWFPQYEKHCIG
jgi:hypothetical protein